MKNYYELLGVTTDMSCEEIKNALAGKSLSAEEKVAYDTLIDEDARNEYDKTLTPVKKTSIKKLVIYGTCGLLLIGGTGLAIANGINNSKNVKVEGTITPGVTDEPEEDVKSTPVPTAVPTATPAPTATPVPTITPAPTPTPIVAEKVEKLSSENIDEVAKQLTESYEAKGLKVNVEDVKSALLVANIENMDKEELDIIIANTTIGNEINKANNFAAALTTHNINAICNNDMKNFVESSKLMYGEADKKVIEYLDGATISVVNPSLTERQYDSSLEGISNFYLELGSLNIKGKNCSYNDLTTGAKYVSEMCSWPNLAVAYTINKHSDDKSYARIVATQNVANDGIRYMTDLSICAQPKELTK